MFLNERIKYFAPGREIGWGNFGVVREATHKFTGMEVAIKILNKKKMAKMKANSYVDKEIRALEALEHPNILYLFQALNTPKEIILVTEKLEGVSLDELIIQKNKLSEELGRRIFQQLISAVAYMHYVGIVHRDIKTENIMVSEENIMFSKEGTVKLIDYGLAQRVTDGPPEDCDAVGTINFQAPEVIIGVSHQDERADLWACGVVLYTMLVGNIPFKGNMAEVCNRISGGRYHIPPFVSRPAQVLIKRILCIYPDQRATVEEIRVNPWFRSNLPAGLFQLRPLTPAGLLIVNKQAAEQVAQMFNATLEEVLDCLQYGRRNAQLTVTYRMVSRLYTEREAAPFLIPLEDKVSSEELYPSVSSLAMGLPGTSSQHLYEETLQEQAMDRLCASLQNFHVSE